ncbi:serine hydrolase domain-containing protein [Bacteroidota bacterium]
MRERIIYIAILACIIATAAGCERERDFDPGFPSLEILGTGPYDGAYWPTDGWKSCSPEEVGMDPDLLRKMNEDVVLQKELHIDAHSVLVIRKGYIVAEQYYSEKYQVDSLHWIYSCTKSITSAAFGIALEKGFIPPLETSLLDFFPGYEPENPDGKDQISLWNALTMSDGIEWNELLYPYSDDRNTFRQWRNDNGNIQFILDRPLKDSPGNSFNYNSGISQLLSTVIQKQTSMRLDSFVSKELFSPLGINEFIWQLNPDGAAMGYSGLKLRPRDLAKFGLLYLKNGQWNSTQVIPESWIRESTSKQILRGDIPGFYYGYHWWVHQDGLYAAVGYGGQLMMIIPEYELIVLFTNSHNTSDSFQNNTPWRILETFILPAIKD